MLRKSITYEDAHHIRTEWDAWDIFKSVMKQVPETETLYGLMESQDYAYPIDG